MAGRGDILTTEVAVAGGGVVGLAIAAALAAEGREVLVLEAGPRCGDETSGRNNQVVHAGFLYPPGSLKAQLCRRGHDRLLDYAAQRGVPVRPAPKLMPAAGAAQLRPLVEAGHAAGLGGLKILGPADLSALEPELRAEAALLSPGTAVIDAPALVAALEAEAEVAGAMILTRTRVAGGAVGRRGGASLRIEGADGEAHRLDCALFVNAAGLGAEAIARGMAGLNPAAVPRIHLARGQFLAHRGPVPFRHLVVPEGPALAAGAALTLDTAGQARFGPDLSFLAAPDYTPDAGVPAPAIAAIRSWWPGLDPARLSVDFVGIRPRVTGPGQPPGDWCILGPAQHGAAGQIHLLGIDTPGLTACLTLAEHVAGLASLADPAGRASHPAPSRPLPQCSETTRSSQP